MLKMKHLEDLCSQVMLWVILQVASNMMSKSWNPVLKSAIKSTSKITSASHEIPMASWPGCHSWLYWASSLRKLQGTVQPQLQRLCSCGSAWCVSDAEMGCEIGGFQNDFMGIKWWWNSGFSGDFMGVSRIWATTMVIYMWLFHQVVG